jgi:hypothetical protein
MNRPRTFVLLVVMLTACEASPDGPDLERHRALCEQVFACNCAHHQFADLEACMFDAAVDRAGWLAEFAAAGLTPDLDCLDRFQAPDPEVCLTTEEYEVSHPAEVGGTLCGVCNVASGERQVGEPCTEFAYWGAGSDCAPGLVCLGPRSVNGVCVDPCAPTPAGLPCDNGVNTCAEGLVCDLERVCVPAAEPGEACEDRRCVEGYTCDDELHRCVALPGAGEPCRAGWCDWSEGLVCASDDVCGPPPQAGEPCDQSCDGGMICHPFEKICAPLGRVGDGCEGGHHCEPGLQCTAQVCVVGGELGDPCVDGLKRCRLGLSCIDGVCAPGQAWSCGDDEGS